MNAQNHSRATPTRVRSILKQHTSLRRSVVTSTPGKIILSAYCVHTCLLIISLSLADLLPTRLPSGFINTSLTAELSLNALIKWDAHWYTYIAEHGYDQQSIVFFPALIICIKALTYLGVDYALAGLLLCNLFALLSFIMMYYTFRLDYPDYIVRRALLAFAVMPTSFYLNSIYTEAMFLFFSLACVYCCRQNKWLLAGIFGAITALTRNLGIFLFIFLVYEFVMMKKVRSAQRSELAALYLPPLALGSFMLFNYKLTGDPLAFLHSQQGWGRYFSSPISNILNNIPLLFNNNPHIQPGATLDTFMVTLTAIAMTVLTVSNRFKAPPSYLIIGWLWLLLPLMSTSAWLPLYSASRFVLVIFPLYLFLGQLKTSLYYCLVAISAVTLTICTALFINWHWIG